MRRLIPLLLLSLCLGGCNLITSTAIKSGSRSYDDAILQTVNEDVLRNIVRVHLNEST